MPEVRTPFPSSNLPQGCEYTRLAEIQLHRMTWQADQADKSDRPSDMSAKSRHHPHVEPHWINEDFS